MMIEKIVRDYLEDFLEIPVFLEHQKKDPFKFVILEKIGSSKKNHLKETTLAIQSYAPSLFQASTLNEEVKNAFENLIFLDKVAFVKFETDYNFTDSETKKYRYQAIFNIKHY